MASWKNSSLKGKDKRGGGQPNKSIFYKIIVGLHILCTYKNIMKRAANFRVSGNIIMYFT